jgi:hypothetical protein
LRQISINKIYEFSYCKRKKWKNLIDCSREMNYKFECGKCEILFKVDESWNSCTIRKNYLFTHFLHVSNHFRLRKHHCKGTVFNRFGVKMTIRKEMKKDGTHHESFPDMSIYWKKVSKNSSKPVRFSHVFFYF